MSELGKVLKAERERRGLSVQEVGLALKISSRVITAIEAGDQNSLPAKTFLRGFVRSYAQLLKLEISAVMGLFQLEYGRTTATPESIDEGTAGADSERRVDAAAQSPGQAGAKSPKRTGSEKSIAPDETGFPVGKALIVVSLFIIVIVVAKLVDKYQKEKFTGTTADETQTSFLKGDSGSAPDGGSTQGTVSQSVPVQPAPSVEPVASTPTPAVAAPVAGAGTTAAVIAPPAAPIATPVAPSTPAPVPSPSVTPFEKLANTTEVIVEAVAGVNIKYRFNNGEEKTLRLEADGIHTFRTKGTIELDVSDGGAVNLVINGRDEGRAGDSGKPIKVKFPK